MPRNRPWPAPTRWPIPTSHFHFGYAAGGGVEIALTNNLTAKAEYLFVDLSAKEYFPNTTEQDGAGYRSDMVRVGFNWLLHSGP